LIKFIGRFLGWTITVVINITASFLFATMMFLCVVVVIADRLSRVFGWAAKRLCDLSGMRLIGIVENCFRGITEWDQKQKRKKRVM
jgi:hypothetical protein